jgi:hypothetical protein
MSILCTLDFYALESQIRIIIMFIVQTTEALVVKCDRKNVYSKFSWEITFGAKNFVQSHKKYFYALACLNQISQLNRLFLKGLL